MSPHLIRRMSAIMVAIWFVQTNSPCFATPDQDAALDWQIAQRLCSQNHFIKARPLLLKLANSKYATAETFLLLGHTYHCEYDANAQSLNMAESYTRKALALDPELGAGYRQLSQIEFRRDNFKLTIDYATKALKTKKPDMAAYLQRAQAYSALKEFASALPDIDTWLKLMTPREHAGSTGKNTLSMRGSVLERLGRLDEAIATYRESLPFRREWNEANIIRCYTAQGKLAQAIAEATVLVQTNPQDDEAFRTRAQLRQKDHDLKGALADYTRAIDLLPANRYLKERAAIYEQLGQKELAKKDLERANSPL